MVLEEVTKAITGAAIEVHRALGPGLLESAYETCLCVELESRHVPFERQVELPVTYQGERLDCGYRLNLVVGGQVVVELKAVAEILPIHQAQLLSYLGLGHFPVGLLITFHVARLVDGIHRRVL